MSFFLGRGMRAPRLSGSSHGLPDHSGRPTAKRVPSRGIPDCNRTKSSACVEFLYKYMLRKILRVVFSLISIFALLWVACQWAVLSSARTFFAAGSDVSAPVAIVLGASVHEDGTPSDILADRLSVAADLYRDGNVAKVLASGDNGQDGYDEVNVMRTYLLNAGVAPEDLFLDHAGFDTFDSVYRARHVFGVTDAIIVTQSYHLPRALYLARSVGINATGVASDLQPYVKQTLFSIRESFARMKAVFDVTIGAKSKYLGDPIDISGDGRVTWDEGISSP